MIEDNTIVATPLIKALSQQGFNIEHVSTAEDALKQLETQTFDIILLDLVLPKMDGQEFIKTFRAFNQTPIIVISQKHSDVGKAISLELGADDYITKPISIIELIARINAVIRRISPDQQQRKLFHKDIMMDVIAQEVYKNNTLIALTVKEFKLLKLFLDHPNSVLSKEKIYKLVWDYNEAFDNNIINVHMRRLRKKIETDPANPKIIETVWGFGYRLSKN